MQIRKREKGTLSGLCGGLLWAADTVLLSCAMAPYGAAWLAPLVSTFLHDAFSALWLMLWEGLHKRLRLLISAFNRPETWKVSAAGLLGGPVGMCAYTCSVYFLGPALAASLSALYPAMGFWIHHIQNRSGWNWKMAAGSGLCVSGILLAVIQFADAFSLRMVLGFVCSLICVLGWTMEGLIIDHISEESSMNTIQMLIIRQSTSACVFLIVVLAVLHAGSFTIELLHSPSMGMLILCALSGTASYLCYYRAIELLSAVQAMPLNITYVLWSFVFSACLNQGLPDLWELLTSLMIFGGSLILAASAQK